MVSADFLGHHSATSHRRFILDRHGLGHPRPGDGGQTVGADVVTCAFHGDDPRHPGNAHLGRAVIGLADIAKQARGRGEEHIGPVVLLAEQLDGGAGHVERTAHVDVDHGVPLSFAHLVEHHVAQDAGGIDHRVQAAEFLLGLFDHAVDGVQVGDAVRIGDRFAARRTDFLSHRLSRARRALVFALKAAAQIVDDDLGALLRGDQRTVTANAVTAAGDQDDLT